MKTAERAVEYYQAFANKGVDVAEVLIEGRSIRVIIANKNEKEEEPGLNHNWGSK